MKVRKDVIYQEVVYMNFEGEISRKYLWWNDSPMITAHRVCVRLTSYEQGVTIVLEWLTGIGEVRRTLMPTNLEGEAIRKAITMLDEEVESWLHSKMT